MTSHPGKFCPQTSSFLYRPHPIRGKGSLAATPIGLKLSGLSSGEEERPALLLGALFTGVCGALIKLGLDVAINWGVLAGFLFLLVLFAYITQRRQRREQTIPWTAVGTLKPVQDNMVEALVRYSGQKRYVRFQFDEPTVSAFLQECREHREFAPESEPMTGGEPETSEDAP